MKTTAAIAAILTTLAASADVQALYWQVTSEMNPTPIAFQAAAMVADDGNGNRSISRMLAEVRGRPPIPTIQPRSSHQS